MGERNLIFQQVKKITKEYSSNIFSTYLDKLPKLLDEQTVCI